MCLTYLDKESLIIGYSALVFPVSHNLTLESYVLYFYQWFLRLFQGSFQSYVPYFCLLFLRLFLGLLSLMYRISAIFFPRHFPGHFKSYVPSFYLLVLRLFPGHFKSYAPYFYLLFSRLFQRPFQSRIPLLPIIPVIFPGLMTPISTYSIILSTFPIIFPVSYRSSIYYSHELFSLMHPISAY